MDGLEVSLEAALSCPSPAQLQRRRRSSGGAEMNRSTSESALATATPFWDAALRREESARNLFQRYDTNGTGLIERSEFASLHRELLRISSTGSLHDVAEDVSPSQLAALTFAASDLDGSGQISFDEFVTMYNAATTYQEAISKVATEKARIEFGTRTAKELSTTTGGAVLGGAAFSMAYKLSRSVANHEHVNISNNHVGKGILTWVRQFDPTHRMSHLVAQSCGLKDAHVVRLAKELETHEHITRLDLRGNQIGGRGVQALHQLCQRNTGITELLLDDDHLIGFQEQAHLQRVRKQLIVNRRAMSRSKGGRRCPGDHRHRHTPLSPIRKSLYEGDQAYDKAVGRSAHGTEGPPVKPVMGIMPALFAAKKKAAGRWRQRVARGKASRNEARQHARDAVKTCNVVVDSAQADASNTDIRHQGNLLMYTDTALHQRKGLRQHPEIVACCDRWWTCIIIPVVDVDLSGQLSRDEYFVFHQCLNRALLAEESDRITTELSSAEASTMALSDWEHDSGGLDTIDHERFQAALFELADLWCETTDPQEYVDFLDWLFGSMVKAMARFPKLTEHQRRTIAFQKRQQRLLADAKRAKVARLASAGVRHMFDDESLARLHRDFERWAITNTSTASSLAAVPKCSRSAFNKIMALQGFPSGSFTSRLFDVFDVSHDHMIDFKELLLGLHMLCASSTDQLCKLVFSLYDLSGSGSITRSDLGTILSVSSRLHGKRSAEDLAGLIDDMFHDGTGNGGTIDYVQFREAVSAHPELIPAMVDVSGEHIHETAKPGRRDVRQLPKG